MLISHDLLKTQKTRKQHLRVIVELYDYATELYNELSRIGIIEQLSNVPQLGAIRVEHKLEKSRYDYVILQLYLHQLVQENLGKNLKFTYGSGIRLHEFGADESKLEGIGAISVADIVQVLTLAYNIGHFYNTFVSSRAVIMMANANETFRQLLYNGSTDERFSQVLETYLADKNYLRFHLLNSLLVLDKCNPDLYSVKLAREILYAYINEDTLEQNNKLKYAFSIFRSIRSVAYIAYDLQVAKVSFTIDLNDEKAMILLLGELLSQYNDRRSSTQLIQSISKDTELRADQYAYRLLINLIMQQKKNEVPEELQVFWEDQYLSPIILFEMFRLFDVYSELKGKEIVYQDHPTPKERQDNIFSMFKDDIPEEMNTEEGNKVLNLILNSSEYAEDWLRYKISKGKL